DEVVLDAALSDRRDQLAAELACRRLLDLDADPCAIDTALASDPVLAPLVTAVPGRRVAGHVDGGELAVRAVLGQQVSVAGARTLAARIVAQHGAALARPEGRVGRLFPTMATLAEADLSTIGLTGARQATVRSVAAAVSAGEVDLGPGASAVEAQ